ncbi:MAG TPA: efflux RND transporter periplasmic adaptor subunit [Caulobacteraceae bacterium]|jgi:RND family efflux transporter MFP subunit|nr:efflux RND transporter periplasmic adaptor subunit [Caulobacteraceae bacterium]
MNIVDWDDYQGQFIAVDSVDIRPRVSGYLLSVGFKDGDMVRKGQVLFLIDPRPYEAALGQAKGVEAHDEAAVLNAQQQLVRGRTLVAAHAISQQAFEILEATERQAAADLVTAKANVQAQALNVEWTRVTAPLAGRVSDRRVAPGNLVTQDTTVLTNITSINPIWFQFTGSEALYLKYQRMAQDGARHSSRVAPTPVQIQLQDEPGYSWRGRMDFVDNQIDPASGVIRQRAVIENPDNFLTPGMFGHLRLLGSGAYAALLIPDAAISSDLNQRVVLILGPNSVLREKAVTVGPLFRGLRVVRSGVGPDDLVVVDTLVRARPGLKITPNRTTITPGPEVPVNPSAPGYINPVPTAASPAADAPTVR